MQATTRARRDKPSAPWRLTDIHGLREAGTVAETSVLWPAPPSGRLSPLLAGLAPTRDHNGELALALQSLPRHRGGAGPVFAVFAADPFLNAKRIAAALRSRNHSRVVNWPTTSQFGATFGGQLDTVRLGPEQECDALRRLAAEGLEVSAAVADAASLPGFLEIQPRRVFVTPAFEHWSHGKIDSARLLRSCASIARVVANRAPIVLMADPRTITPAQARAAGAESLLTP